MRFIILIIAVIIVSCQGQTSKDPPIHLNPNMDKMPKYKAQSESQFFVNGSAMREPSAGTLATDEAQLDDAYYTGKDGNGQLISAIPVPISKDFMLRGQERFNIYCSPCHARTGEGNGIVVQRGFVKPPTYHSDVMRQNPAGHFFTVMSQGIRSMPTYKHQVPVMDRWAIVSYIRALQRSQNASAADIPKENLKDLK
jgi:hypothetical protein